MDKQPEETLTPNEAADRFRMEINERMRLDIMPEDTPTYGIDLKWRFCRDVWTDRCGFQANYRRFGLTYFPNPPAHGSVRTKSGQPIKDISGLPAEVIIADLKDTVDAIHAAMQEINA